MMASRQRHTRIPSANSTATTQTAASTASTAIPGPGQPSGTMPASGSTAPSVRRNLFHSHQSHTHNHHPRRPTPSTSSSLAGGHNTLTNGTTSGTSGFNSSKSVPTAASSVSTANLLDNGDIVARDKNGCYKVDIPILPPAVFGEDVDGGDAMEGIEQAGPGGRITETEKEKIDATIAEMMRHNRSRQINGEHSEVLLLIQQSLRTRVAELEEDKWMYEVDDEIHV